MTREEGTNVVDNNVVAQDKAGQNIPAKDNGGFFACVYEVVRRIPRGKVATYGQIAKIIGRPRAARYVGYALHVNPLPGIIPCHRVVNREGNLTASFAFGGIEVQQDMLTEEGITVKDGKADLAVYRWDEN